MKGSHFVTQGVVAPKHTFLMVDACRAFDLGGWFSGNLDKGMPGAGSVADLYGKLPELELSED